MENMVKYYLLLDYYYHGGVLGPWVTCWEGKCSVVVVMIAILAMTGRLTHPLKIKIAHIHYFYNFFHSMLRFVEGKKKKNIFFMRLLLAIKGRAHCYSHVPCTQIHMARWKMDVYACVLAVLHTDNYRVNVHIHTYTYMYIVIHLGRWNRKRQRVVLTSSRTRWHSALFFYFSLSIPTYRFFSLFPSPFIIIIIIFSIFSRPYYVIM